MTDYAKKSRRSIPPLSLKLFFEHGHKDAPKEGWLAGRIVGILDDGFVLQDDEERIDLVYNSRVNVGDIIEASVVGEKRVLPDGKEQAVYVVKEFAVLTPCRDEFFIRKEDPNYRKAVIDRSILHRMKERAFVVDAIREFFKREGFLEVETPLMVKLPGMEPYLDVFKSQFVDIKGRTEDRYLITSPEYALKKLLVSGFGPIFQMSKSFRNKETDSELHNPEFTLLEWYRAFADYTDIMSDTERMVEYVAKKMFVQPTIRYRDNVIDVSAPWPRKKVKDLFLEYAGIEHADFEDEARLRKVVAAKGYPFETLQTYDDLFFVIFMNEIEPKLGFDKPVIVYDYPVSMASLSRVCEDDPKYAERFEAYIAGVELCNAFTELNDPVEQKKRLENERIERQNLKKEDYSVDQSFIRALEFGMPPSGGNALGVDRLVMLMTNTPDIRDVILFPNRDL